MINPPTHRRSEKGQALMLLIVGIVGLFGFLALAIDGGMIYADRRYAQNAADAGALAGAYEIARLTQTPAYNSASARESIVESAAATRVASNDFSNDSDTTVTVNYPPASGPYTGNQEYVQVSIADSMETNLAHFVYDGPLSTSVEAVARAEPGYLEPAYDGNALVSLSPHDCMQFKLHGNQSTIVDGGGIFVNSDEPTCAMTMNGASGWVVSSDAITVVGGIDETSHLCHDYTVVSGNIVCTTLATTAGIVHENIGPTAARPFPPVDEVPTPTCTGSASVTGSTLSPGNWTGAFPPSGVNTLQSGIYCVNGDFKVNSGEVLEGHGVLIYMIDGGISWNGAATITLDPMTTGDYADMLIYVDPQGYGTPDSSDCLTLNGGAGINVTGTVYAPNSEINLLGNAGAQAFKSQFIGYTIEVGGTANLSIQYNEADNYWMTYPPAAQIAQ